MSSSRRWLLASALLLAPIGQALEHRRPSTGAHRDPIVVNAPPSTFVSYLGKHGKMYEAGSTEYQMRERLFNERAAAVQRHNSNADRLWNAGLNHFSDSTDEELRAMHGWKRTKRSAEQELAVEMKEERKDEDEELMPKHWNWLRLSNMKYIRDQGACGSCWAIAASTVLGAHSEINATNRSFSTQEIVDCVPNPDECGGQGGCQGATVELAFQYTMNFGLKQPSKYGAYNAKDGACPRTHTEDEVFTLTQFSSEAAVHKAEKHSAGLRFGMWAWRKLPSNKYRPLLRAVYDHGPVAVALAANNLPYYESGVFDGCGDDWVVNHAVTLIGFGIEDEKTEYWLVQNSWGSAWGEDGRFRLIRKADDDENCGMDSDPQAGLACKGEVEPVQVCGACGILYDSVVPLFDGNKI